MQLHELHPALVHFPIALLPASLAVDAAGRNHAGLAEVGRIGIALTAGSAALAAASGLIAQEEVEVNEATHELLVTHRTLNLGVLGWTAAMAVYRAGRERAGSGYLAAGVVALGVTMYTAYLGGQMVYKHGVGVRPAGGLAEDHTPPLAKTGAGSLLYRSWHNLRHALAHTAEHLGEGEVAPALSTQDADHAHSDSSSDA